MKSKAFPGLADSSGKSETTSRRKRMEPVKVLVALAWGVLLGTASLSLADRLFPQPVSVSPAISISAEPERQGDCGTGRMRCSDGTPSPSCECDGAAEAAD